ncbi:LysR family transcriptional regulator [Actinocatenispora sera]|uniref:LysR family transcriptional regulator n=1 Tax=Actinocatenispora sera TaxID=390989 RepID=UPI0033F833A8
METTGPAARTLGFDLLDLELFAQVVEAGSITHGSREVHLALPSASARIRQMERAIGTPLLTRGRRGVTVTPAGLLLLRHAHSVLHQIDRMRGDLTEYATGLVATIRLLANTAAATTTLPEELVTFLVAHPAIDVDLEERPSHLIVQAVAEGRAEIGIVASSVSVGQLRHVALRDDRLALVTPPKHRFARRRRIRFEECLDQPFIGLSEGSALQEHLEGHAQPLGQRPHYRLRLPSVETVCQTVAAGVGVGVLPIAAVRRWQHVHHLATVPLSDDWAARQLLLVTHPTVALSAPAAALRAHLASTALAGDPAEETRQ